MEYPLPEPDALNVAELKAHLSEYLDAVEKQGMAYIVSRRNVPIAKIIPIEKPVKNRTKLGWSVGQGETFGDLTEPMIPLEDWEMLKP
ncbi:MAG TPA: type II toxin-antitoxin system prevent-host-death family antitoxin [Fibrobacteria bacterium]|jgi:prevent-host-death family protein|nr:type II toxin-antitoxin system prevent-host-death family antitoxin [Fibrobacteria bacterium]